MTFLWLDTEFNSWGGDLISMGIVDDKGNEFYEEIQLKPDLMVTDWVMYNVFPKLNKKPTSYEEFQRNLENFLLNYGDGFSIYADWPEDLKHFLQALIIGPGRMMPLPPFSMSFSHHTKINSTHNALEDAKILKAAW